MRRLLGLALGLSTLLGSCGYSSSLRLPEERETVGVEVFANDSPLPVLERALYQALDDSVASMVSGDLVTPSRADLVIRGRILDYWRLAGIFGRENQLQESGVNLEVVVWLHDRKTGRRLGGEVRVRREVRYTVNVGTSEDGALELALRTLTQEIVLDLFSEANYAVEDEEPGFEPDPGTRPLPGEV